MNSAQKSSLKTLMVTMGSVFVCEALVMVILPHIPAAQSLEIIADPILLSLMTAPLLSVALLKPLRRAMERQKKSEEEANVAREAAVNATQAKSRFLSQMSHEIRTPLNGVVGMAGLLLESDLDEDQTEYAEAIDVCSGQLVTLINDILDFSKIEAGKLELEAVDIDVRNTVRETRDIVVATYRDLAGKLICHVSPDVPASLLGDPLRLRQILINLTNNAVKYAEGGDITLKVDFVENVPSHVLIRCSVHDNGVGIPDDKLKLLFREFSQTDSSTSREYGGTGLGLAISKQLAELMGGEIGVESEVGKGSTFWFTVKLQRSRGASEPMDRGIVEAAPVALTGERRPERILLADDNPINRRYGVLLLDKRFGFQVDVVTNGREVLEALGRQDYDLVLMDCQMPDLDGLEAARMIRDPRSPVRNHDIPIVALTARAMKKDLQECTAAGMDDYITKPIDTQILARTIDRLLSLNLTT